MHSCPILTTPTYSLAWNTPGERTRRAWSALSWERVVPEPLERTLSAKSAISLSLQKKSRMTLHSFSMPAIKQQHHGNLASDDISTTQLCNHNIHADIACSRCHSMFTLPQHVHAATACSRCHSMFTLPQHVHAATACSRCHSMHARTHVKNKVW